MLHIFLKSKIQKLGLMSYTLRVCSRCSSVSIGKTQFSFNRDFLIHVKFFPKFLSEIPSTYKSHASKNTDMMFPFP